MIGGCARSGTTLLLSMLSCHPRLLAIPNETMSLCPTAYELSDEDFARRVETLGLDIERSSEAGREQEQLNSIIAPDDNATRLERRFDELSIPARLRLGLGTSHVTKAAGWEAKRLRLRVQINELLEALESIEPIGGATTTQPAGTHPQHGELVRLTGLTSSGRAITLVAQVEKRPMTLVDIAVEAV